MIWDLGCEIADWFESLVLPSGDELIAYEPVTHRLTPALLTNPQSHIPNPKSKKRTSSKALVPKTKTVSSDERLWFKRDLFKHFPKVAESDKHNSVG